MHRLRWWLLGSAVPAATACAVSWGDSGPRFLGELTLALLGLVTAALLWHTRGPRQPRTRGWPLIAVAALLGVIDLAATVVVRPTDPIELLALRWLPSLPAYLLGVVGILTLVDRTRLRTGARTAVELALFCAACVVVVQRLIIGPGGSWLSLPVPGRLILVAAVVTTSVTMATALTVLGVVERRRQPMAVVLLGSTVLLTAGHAVDTSALLTGAAGAADLSRFLVLAGMVLLGTAALLDPGAGAGTGDRPARRSGPSTGLGQLLPHVAMVAVVAVVAVVTLAGHRPSPVTVLGALCCVVLAAVHRWITARDEQLLGARLRRRESYFRSLVRSSGDAVLILDGELRLTWASPALGRMLGGGAPAASGQDLLELVHPEDADPVAHALRGQGGGAPAGGPLPLRMRHADGTWRSLEIVVSDLRSDADVGAIVLHCRDVTERLARERALEQVAFTDPVTGLPNWAGCARAVDRLLVRTAAAGARTPAGDPRGSLLLLELTGLDEVREDAGRDLVNTVLVEIGGRLRGTVRGTELVARVGGGAFAVLAEGAGHTADLLADRCLSAVEQPITTEAGVFDLTASVGVVELEPGLTVPDVMGRAELAVRTAGPGTARRYQPALGNAAARRARLRDDLPGAWARGELAVLFQPVVSLEQQRVTGVEALLRWRHPELGDVPPAEFLPIAERAGVIGELQRWALERAASAAVALPDTGNPLRLGVNISASHVAARTIVGDVAAVLASTGLAPERLILEITEAIVAADGDHVAADFEALRLMGVHVALDHFGTGQSSLTHLTRISIDVLKLDRSFVARIDRDPKVRALCESIVAIGRALGLDVVADGVETPAQLGALRALGCGFAQGFLLARPLVVAELTELLQEGAGALWPGLVGSR